MVMAAFDTRPGMDMDEDNIMIRAMSMILVLDPRQWGPRVDAILTSF